MSKMSKPIQSILFYLMLFTVASQAQQPPMPAAPTPTPVTESNAEETESDIEIEPAVDEALNEDAAPEAEDSDIKKDPPLPDKRKFNRRVMLMVFINESHDKDTEYLAISVPDAFATPLTKTGNFVILNRNSVERYMKAMSIPHDDIYKEENATRLGKAIGADVVVVGKFLRQGDSVTVEAMAVDVQAGRVSVQDREEIKTNTTMFNSISKLAERMSGPMAEKMQPLETPPPPAEVVLDEKQVEEEVKKIEEKKAVADPAPKIAANDARALFLEPGISFLQAPGVTGKQIAYDGKYAFGQLNPGISVSLVFVSSLPHWSFLNFMRAFDYAAALEYARYAAAYEVVSSTGQTLIDSETMRLQTFGGSFSLARAFPVWYFTLTPYAGFSIDYANFTASDSTALFKGVIPGANVGCRWRIYQWRAFEIAVNWRSGFRYLNDGNSFLNHAIFISGGYRL